MEPERRQAEEAQARQEAIEYVRLVLFDKSLTQEEMAEQLKNSKAYASLPLNARNELLQNLGRADLGPSEKEQLLKELVRAMKDGEAFRASP